MEGLQTPFFMFKHIKIIKTGINPKPFLDRVYDNWVDWEWVSSLNSESVGGDKDPYGFLPLVWARVKEGESPKDTEFLEQTPLYSHYPEVIDFWKNNNIRSLGRAAFFKLEPDGKVFKHIDEGAYYLKRDRYHLSLQSRYHYTVGNEEMIVEPGTFFWFNNKLPHSAHNIGDVDRISLVFDVPHHKKNPHHKIREKKGFI